MSHGVSLVERVPLIRLRGYLLVSIQVALTDRMVIQLRDDIAQTLAHSDVRALIVDVSGIDLMDSFIARAIHDIGLVSQLMGVETAVCGFDPMIAMTLVEMGVELNGVTTTRDLDSAIEQLDARVAEDERADAAMFAQAACEVAGGLELFGARAQAGPAAPDQEQLK